MFRIKTDIRQYKCETKDKVEKLIRNWVIRPSDLIYDADERDWSPIGDHPSFVSLFGVLDEQEKNTPDTVVTKRSPYANSKDEAEDEPPQEVTMLVGRPTPDAPQSEAEDDDLATTEDLRKTDFFDEEAPKPPQAPEGVEPPSNDEVTTMTERTLDMLMVDEEEEEDPEAGDDAEKDADAEPDEGDEGDEGDEEDKQDDAEADGDDDEEVTGVREREDPPAPIAEDSEEMRTTDEVPQAERKAEADKKKDDEKKKPSKKKETPKEDAKPVEPPRPKAPPAEKPRITRKDLPEELFTTNEISSPMVREHMARLDELADADAKGADETIETAPDSDPDVTFESGRSKSKIRLSEDSGVDEAWEMVAEELRATEELDAAVEEDLRELSEQSEEISETTVEDEPSDNFDDDGDDDWSDDTSEPEIVEIEAIASDGYAVPLPFAVGPTPEDIRKGMPQSNKISMARRNAVFPLPQPKNPEDVHAVEFDFNRPPPRDLTFAIALGVLLIIITIAIVARSC